MSENIFGFDINQPLGSRYPRVSYNVPQAYYTGIVEDIVLNESGGKYLTYQSDGSNIGIILVRILPTQRNVPFEKLSKAFPLESNIQSYPLKGEQVLLFKTMGRLYYTRPVATTRKVTENLWITLRESFQAKNSELETDSRRLSSTGAAVGDEFMSMADDTLSPGSEFIKNPTVRSVRANEGDVILQGRFGNIIRFGSTLVSDPTRFPDANLLLSVGLNEQPTINQVSTSTVVSPHSLVYENLDTNKSSIWMVANQEIKFTAATQTSVSDPQAHLLTAPKKVGKYDGAQIIINSDRVLVNSKLNEISLFSKKEINLCAIGAISLNTENDVFIRSFGDINLVANKSIFIKAPAINISSNNSQTFETTETFTIKGSKVYIGRYGTNMEPIVLGNSLAKFLDSLVEQVQSLQAVTTTIASAIIPKYTPIPASALSIPPLLVQVNAALVAAKLKLEVLSVAAQSGRFNSKDNFTTKSNT